MLRLTTLVVIACSLAACGTSSQPTAPNTESTMPAATGAATSASAPSVIAPVQSSPSPSPALAQADSFPDASAYTWAQFATGLDSPVGIEFPDDGTGRMFVLEQAGRIRIIENGQLLNEPFLDIHERVGSSGNEQGLLGLAFHRDFKSNPFFYVNYTDRNGDTVIARYQANGDTADPAGAKQLLGVDQPYRNHNGGEVTFGPDGYLYLGLGDGGSQGDPNGNGQNTNVLLGKVLRIDVDHGDPYAIPPDNPFANGGGRPEVWAYGLRNPWRFSFDKYGNLLIADVGQDAWEEVDIAAGNPPGLNYGWNYFEGTHPYSGTPPAGLNITMPVTEYSHGEGGCSIIGGYVYAGQMPEWQGIYLYGDYCSGKVWGLLPPPNSGSTEWKSQLLFETRVSVTSFGQDPSGEIYFADRGGGIYRLQK